MRRYRLKIRQISEKDAISDGDAGTFLSWPVVLDRTQAVSTVSTGWMSWLRAQGRNTGTTIAMTYGDTSLLGCAGGFGFVGLGVGVLDGCERLRLGRQTWGVGIISRSRNKMYRQRWSERKEHTRLDTCTRGTRTGRLRARKTSHSNAHEVDYTTDGKIKYNIKANDKKTRKTNKKR